MKELNIEFELAEELTKEQIDAILGRKKGRPLMKAATPFYAREADRHPERIRVTFDDGSEEVYQVHVEQPKPVFVEVRNRDRRGYVNQPERRRGRK